jgi:hypothetical protein
VWRAIQPAAEAAGHPDCCDLGQYAAICRCAGRCAADGDFPLVAAHLAEGCNGCHDTFRELLLMLADGA